MQSIPVVTGPTPSKKVQKYNVDPRGLQSNYKLEKQKILWSPSAPLYNYALCEA